MRRRKLLIGLGALSAGGSAAFGTEAFTSAQAERNADVSVVGDSKSFVAISSFDSDNADKYVSTEEDGTVQLNLDGDNTGSGQGVAPDSITELDDLFTIINQGSQPVNIYFEDDSEAVTFRVTRSSDVTTQGSNGDSIEGPSNAVNVGVGQQVVVGITVDTIDTDVDKGTQVLDNVDLIATANDPAGAPSTPANTLRIVDPSLSDPDGNRAFTSLSDAVSAAVDGDTIEIQSDVDVRSPLTIDTPGVRITGSSGGETINYVGGYPGTDAPVVVSGDDVTLGGVEIKFNAVGTDGTINGRSLDKITGAQPNMRIDGANFLATGTTFTIDGVFDGNANSIVVRGRGTGRGADTITFDGVTLQRTGNSLGDNGLPSGQMYLSGAPLFGNSDADRVFEVKNSTFKGGVRLDATGVSEGQRAIFEDNTFTDGPFYGEAILLNTLNGNAQVSGNSFDYTVENTNLSDNRKPTQVNSLSNASPQEEANNIASQNNNAAVQYIPTESGTVTAGDYQTL